ncbi:MAG: mannose-1-phosphate guanylyltransferase/mannose-6-phosphate isomerase [Thermodesulfobacteriota bacterium]
MHIQPIILAGGVGSRLWPLSRELYPKQLLSLTEESSLLQATLKRVMALVDTMPPVVVIGENHRFLVLKQLEELGLDQEVELILEPVGRNTASAVYSAAVYCRYNHEEDIVFLVLPADHLIRKEQAFQEAVKQAVELCGQGKLVTFGITPGWPETGYGYIEKGEGSKVLSFVEKPDQDRARQFLEAGNYYWNSGMFAFDSHLFILEMEEYCPAIVKAINNAVDRGRHDPPFFRLDRESMESLADDSLDYALMEKTDKAAVIPADLGWSDIGSWKALWDVMEKDDDGNIITGDVITRSVNNSLIRAEQSLIAAIGLENMLVVETPDAILVSGLDKSQEVKQIVQHLKRKGRGEPTLHRKVYRPWGSYTVLEEQDSFKIKRLTVNPGAKLSLQMHHHRSEHWVVVKGTAKVTCGEKEYLVLENQSTYIPCGEKHRLANPGVILLELIEVQNGSYLGEDDITRFEDDFGRQGYA